MHIAIICRVIDNYGDAGFSLRLALEICRRGHHATILCDNVQVLLKLIPSIVPSNLKIIDTTIDQHYTNNLLMIEAVIECFGSSTCTDSSISNDLIQQRIGKTPWLIVDYLSAEPWIENFHGVPSINPRTGYESIYFYPGFSNKTGGVIHSDFLATAPDQTHIEPARQKIFVFCYPQAPLKDLDSALLSHQELWVSEKCAPPEGNIQPFCPIDEFDKLLLNFDWCFVRGEDSFVRTQLAGKPFVWQIYPTSDFAHKDKLGSFFELYSKTLSIPCKEALRTLWWSWNGLEQPRFDETWQTVNQHYLELSQHAQRWATELRNGPELVSEILTTIQDSALFRPI